MSVKCRICGQAAYLMEHEKLEKHYYHCVYCDYIFMDEKEIISHEAEKHRYDQHKNTLDNRGYVNMFECFIEQAIIPYENQIDTALDFGCGPGPVLAYLLKQRGIQVDVYDIYFQPKKVYENKKYNLITSTEVFEHLKYPMEQASTLLQRLTPNGILALMTSFHSNDVEQFSKWWYRKDDTHIGFFNAKTFEYIAKANNAKVIFNNDKNICVLQKDR